ncbi:hypothetical protein [Marinobacter similis]|uniref:Uncharacterized protein n=1 Tax=Marinobacter similis TaxID=1420916 RepID=W5YKY9_9GAMM|nr:hypothetical protein [Marinobacter similis]AHI29720.1 hypothetical protein AU14_17660 [Marinobacter similis]
MSKQAAEIKARSLMTELLYAQEGKFVGVTFTTDSGRVRELNGRLGVKRYLTKGVNPQAGDTLELATIWDRQIGGYRRFNVNRLQGLRAGGMSLAMR